MKIISLGLVAFFVLCQSAMLEAQGIRRSVIASFGASGQAGGLRLACTAGQPPNAGTISGGGLTLRQGFQQPLSDSSNVVNPDCIGLPLADFSVDNFLDVCGEKFSFAFEGTPQTGTTFSWNFGQNALPFTSDLQDPLGIIYTSTGPKLVTLEVTTGACVSTKTYQINVQKASFGVFAEGAGVVCFEDANGSLALTPLNGQLPYIYEWTTGATTSFIDQLTPGSYGFTVTDAIGCSFVSDGTVDGPDSLHLAFSVKVESCDDLKDGAVNLSVEGGTSPFSFSWKNLNGNYAAETEDITELDNDIYAVTVTDASGCVKNEVVEVKNVCEDGFKFKELITPNGDGTNDTWIVDGIDNFPDNELEIFNRWGELVYDVKGYNNTWQGTNNRGKPLPVGAYFFMLRLNDEGNTVFSGSVSILK